MEFLELVVAGFGVAGTAFGVWGVYQWQKGKLELARTQRELERCRERQGVVEGEYHRLSGEVERLERELERERDRWEEERERLKEESRQLAERLLQLGSREVGKEAKEQLTPLLSPLREELDRFKNRLEEWKREEREKIGGLAHHLSRLEELNRTLSEEAKKLTEALKGEIRSQGAWGEAILKRILELSGLVEGREFQLQPTYLNGDGKKVRPDVVVYLPGGGAVIIDAKTPLVSFYNYLHASTPPERQKFLEQFLKSIETHLKNLGEKGYYTISELDSPPFVIMFIPIEGAVATALTHAPHLMEEGLRRGIIIASPSTLLMGLKVVETLWKRERRWEGVAEVGEMATQLYNKMALFLKELEKVERGLNSALKGLEGAKGKLTSPRSGILRQLERLREKAGAEGTKELPKGYQVN